MSFGEQKGKEALRGKKAIKGREERK